MRVAFLQDRRQRLKVSQFRPFLQKQKCVHESQVSRLGDPPLPLREGIAKPGVGVGEGASGSSAESGGHRPGKAAAEQANMAF